MEHDAMKQLQKQKQAGGKKMSEENNGTYNNSHRGCQCDGCRESRGDDSGFDYLDARDRSVRYNEGYWDDLESYKRLSYGWDSDRHECC